MVSPAPKRLTLSEFLEWDDGTDRRYELLDGVPIMMARSLEAHGELAPHSRSKSAPDCNRLAG